MGGKYTSGRRLEIMSNNVANALTPGFKASRLVFSVEAVGDPDDPTQTQQTYVNISDSYVHFSDAPFVQTGNPFDLGIEGDGFFVVSTPQGNMYTRNGQFTLSTEKKLVTADGYPVMSAGGGEITIDGKEVKIEVDGSIYVDGVRTERVKVVDFEKKNSLKNFGKSLFQNTDTANAEGAAANASIRQGAYESSNVEVVKEMVELIETVRAFEAYTKVDQMTADAVDKLIQLAAT